MIIHEEPCMSSRDAPCGDVLPPFIFKAKMDAWRMQNNTAYVGVISSEATPPPRN